MISQVLSGWFVLGVVLGARLIQAAEGPTLETMSSELRRQDRAWNDLEIDYVIESEVVGDDGAWRSDPPLRMTWKVTQDGWQRVRRERDTESGTWVEEAGYNGEYYMAADSQGVGSGAIGHQNERFLYNSYVPRLYGLAVTGQELSQPLSVADFLKSSDVVARPGDSGLIRVEGPDPFAEGVTLAVELDPSVGYRPRRLEIFDRQGPLSTYDNLQYRELKGARGSFWFPESGVWKGIQPRDRSEASRLTYRLNTIRVDTTPTAADFVLTWKKGALLLNNDTGETVYLRDDSTPGDIPNFEGKRMSIAEHDRLAQKTIDTPPIRRSRWNLLIACNLIGIAAVLIVIFARPARKKRDA